MQDRCRYFNGSPEVIRRAVMMYVRYPRSLGQVEDGFVTNRCASVELIRLS